MCLFLDLVKLLFYSKPEGQNEEKHIILLIFLETMTQFLLFGEVVDMRILCEE